MQCIYQEKNQVEATPKPESDMKHEWASFESARDPNVFTDPTGENARFASLPPGMEIANQPRAEINQMPLVMAGQTDVSADTNPASFANGFRRIPMKGTDEMFTNEHSDIFYATVYDDEGRESFIERGNVLDRG